LEIDRIIEQIPADKIYYKEPSGVIICDDCLSILPLLEPNSVDLVVTDPPYGLDIVKTGKVGGGKIAPVKDYGASDWDKKPPPPEYFEMIKTFGRNQVIWGGNYFVEWLNNQSGWLVWDKDNTGNFADCELAWTSLSTAVRKFKYRWNGMIQEHGGRHKEERVHPTQKPLALMRWCISLDKSNPRVILDSHFGSGVVLVAAKQLGRKFIGIEIEEKYCEIAKQRLAQEELFNSYGEQ